MEEQILYCTSVNNNAILVLFPQLVPVQTRISPPKEECLSSMCQMVLNFVIKIIGIVLDDVRLLTKNVTVLADFK